MSIDTRHFSEFTLIAIGIDVSKAELVVGGMCADGQWVMRIENTWAAATELVEVLCAINYRGKIVLESTGYYHWASAIVLSQAGLDVRLVNPLLAIKVDQARQSMRKRLYQCAWGACLNDNQFRAYYDTLKAKGRSHTEAVNMIARKLLRIVFTVIKTQTPYDKNKAWT